MTSCLNVPMSVRMAARPWALTPLLPHWMLTCKPAPPRFPALEGCVWTLHTSLVSRADHCSSGSGRNMAWSLAQASAAIPPHHTGGGAVPESLRWAEGCHQFPHQEQGRAEVRLGLEGVYSSSLGSASGLLA